MKMLRRMSAKQEFVFNIACMTASFIGCAVLVRFSFLGGIIFFVLAMAGLATSIHGRARSRAEALGEDPPEMPPMRGWKNAEGRKWRKAAAHWRNGLGAHPRPGAGDQD